MSPRHTPPSRRRLPAEPRPHEVSEWLRRVLSAELDIIDVARLSYGPGFTMPVHSVTAPKVLLVTKGTLPYTLNGRTFRLAPGMFVHRPPQSTASWDAKSRVEFWYCEYSAELPGVSAWPSLLGKAPLPEELEAFAQLYATRRSPNVWSDMEAEAILKLMLARIVRGSMEVPLHSGERGPALSPSAGAHVVRAMAWLGENYHLPDALSTLRLVVGLNDVYFRSIFKRKAGVTPGGYLKRIRLRAAQLRLMHDGRSIKEVAHDVGYRDALFFSKQYHSHFGHSPSADVASRM